MKRFLLLFLIFYSIDAWSQNYVDHMGEGNRALNQGKFRIAEEHFREGVVEEPRNWVYYNQLAHALINQRRFFEADSFLNIVLENEPRNMGAIWYKGLGSFKNKRDSTAIYYFKMYLPFVKNKNPRQTIRVYWHIGMAYRRMLSKDGLYWNQVSDMLYYLELYVEMTPGEPNNQSIDEFVEEVKKNRPGKSSEKWVFKA